MKKRTVIVKKSLRSGLKDSWGKGDKLWEKVWREIEIRNKKSAKKVSKELKGIKPQKFFFPKKGTVSGRCCWGTFEPFIDGAKEMNVLDVRFTFCEEHQQDANGAMREVMHIIKNYIDGKGRWDNGET